MDNRNLINVDDLVRQRLGGGEEQELPGAWPRMLDLLEKEEKKRILPFFFWRRGIYFAVALLLLTLCTIGGIHFSPVLDGFRGALGLGARAEHSNNETSGYSPNKTPVAAKTPSRNTQLSSTAVGSYVQENELETNNNASGKSSQRSSTAVNRRKSIASVGKTNQQSKRIRASISETQSSQATPSLSNSANTDQSKKETISSNYAKKTGIVKENQYASGSAKYNKGIRKHATNNNVSNITIKDTQIATKSSDHDLDATENSVADDKSTIQGLSTDTRGKSNATYTSAQQAKHPSASKHTSINRNHEVNITGKRTAKNNKPHSSKLQNDITKRATNDYNLTNNAVSKKVTSNEAIDSSVSQYSSAGTAMSASRIAKRKQGYDSDEVSINGKRTSKNTTAVTAVRNLTDTDISSTQGTDETAVTNVNSHINKENVVETSATAKRTQRYRTNSKYQVQKRSKLDDAGKVTYHQDTINVSVDSFKLASNNEDATENGMNEQGKKNATTVGTSDPLKKLASSKANNQPKLPTGLNQNTAKKTASGNAASKAKKISKSHNHLADTDNDEKDDASNQLSLVAIKPIRNKVIVPQSSMPLASLPALSKGESKKKKSNHLWEDISNSFNDITYNFSHAEFSPGITGGINATFFGPNNFKGFQFGFTGAFLLDDKWSFFGELKYFHRMNSNYSLKDTYIDYGNNDSVINSFNFSTLHSFEMPWSVRYTIKNCSFFAGANFLYTLAVNTGAAPLTYSSTTPYAAGRQSTPTMQEADFGGRFGMGYLFGFSMKVAPNLSLDVRNVQTVWDNTKTGGAKNVSAQLYKSPSLQFSIQYRFGGKHED